MSAFKSILVVAIVGCILGQSIAEHVITFSPQGRFQVRLRESKEILVTFSSNITVDRSQLIFNCSSMNEAIARAVPAGNKSIELWHGIQNYTFHCLIEPVRLGRANISATISMLTDSGDVVDLLSLGSVLEYIQAIVIQPQSVWNQVVQYGLLAALGLNSIAFGLKIDWGKVKEFLKKPCGIFIAFACQYVLLPAVAFVVGHILKVETHIKVALLAVSCVPGGLPSNAITMAFNGDVNLSIVLTALGNVGAFVMTPLWMYTLGQAMLQDTYPGLVIRLPWVVFCILIAVLTVPTIAGIAFGVRHPKLAPKLAMVLRLIGITSALVLVGIMLWVYSWAFDYLDNWKIIVAGIATPYVAFALSFGLSMIFLRNLTYATTITIETGVQNISFSFFLIGYSLPAPDSSLAISVPTIIVLSTYIPLLVACLIRVVYQVVRSKYAKEKEESLNSVSFVSSTKLGEPNVFINGHISDKTFDENFNEKPIRSASTIELVVD